MCPFGGAPGFAVNFDERFRTTVAPTLIDRFGVDAIYKPQSGLRTTIRAIFDDASTLIDDGTEAGVMRSRRQLTVSAIDVPVPTEGDQVRVDDAEYVVVQPILSDRDGVFVLFLQELT